MDSPPTIEDATMDATMTTTATATVTDTKEKHINACFGRYRGWKSVSPTPLDAAAPSDATEEDLVPSQPDSEALPAATADSDMTVDASTDAKAPLPSAIVVQFEATAREDLRVGFAPPRVGRAPSQWVYEVALGYSGNTEVVWRKHVAVASSRSSSSATERETDLVKVFAGRTCSPTDFVAYWIVIQSNALVVGLGSVVGSNTIAKCVDEAFIHVHQVAFTTWDAPATVRNVSISTSYNVLDALDVLAMTPSTIVRADPLRFDATNDLVTPAERAAFDAACDAAKRRAERFNALYVAPAIKSFVDAKTIRKLQRLGGAATTEPGFATGFDLSTPVEVEKREQRMQRFETASTTETTMRDGLTQAEWLAQQTAAAKLQERALKFGLSTSNPESQFNLVPATRKVETERRDVGEDDTIVFRDDAIHMYSLDERFQTVRTNDVLLYFKDYRPSYVEWINDSACTIVFEDAFTAGRALVRRSVELPLQTIVVPETTTADDVDDVEMDMEASAEAPATQTPLLNTSFNRSHWRFGDAIASDNSDKRWRVLLRRATDDDFPAEKLHKKYHERSSRPTNSRLPTHTTQPLHQRGRGHRTDHNNGSGESNSMPSRYSTSSRRRDSSSRAHPYAGNRNNSRNRRNADDNDSRQDGRRNTRGGSHRDTGTPSDRIRVNDDGSINIVRPGDNDERNASAAAAETPASLQQPPVSSD